MQNTKVNKCQKELGSTETGGHVSYTEGRAVKAAARSLAGKDSLHAGYTALKYLQPPREPPT
jgi:hypothetical protein